MDPKAQEPGSDAPTIPGYDFLKRLPGGHGAGVYLALQKNFDRHVAVKITRSTPAADNAQMQGTLPIQRFLREARIAARLNHPHIIRVFDVGQYQGIAFLTMEFQEGGDLKRRLQRDIRLGQVLSITRQLASALDHAHGAGYVHGDIQPENILLSKYEKAILGNFGQAHATQVSRGPASPSASRPGAQRYMSPEQLRGLALDARSDFYSLGVVFFEMLTGTPPFDHPDVTSLSMMILNNPTPMLRDNLKALQPLLDGLLNRDIANRYASGRELIQDIDRISSEVPDQNLPRSRPLRATRADSVSNVGPPPRQIPDADAQRPLNEVRQQLKRDRHPLQRKAAVALGAIAVAAGLYYIATSTPVARWLGPGAKPSAIEPEQVRQLLEANADSLGGALGSYLAPGRSDGAVLAAGAAEALTDLKPAGASTEAPAAAGPATTGAQRTRIENLLVRARALEAAGKLRSPEGNNAQQYYQQVLMLDAENREAKQGLRRIADGHRGLEQQRQRSAEPRGQSAAATQPAAAQSDRAQTLLNQFKITGLLKGANYDLSAGRYTSPTGGNALEKYQQVLSIEPENREALNGMVRLERQIVRDLDAALAAGDDTEASRMRQQLKLLNP